MKREAEDAAGQHHYKKHKSDRDRGHDRVKQDGYKNGKFQHAPTPQKTPKHDHETLATPPASSSSARGAVDAYVRFSVSPSLPPLPEIKPGPLASAPFRHKSSDSSYNRTTDNNVTYEKLEFLGDAQIELIASRLIFDRFPELPAGRQSQLRELLVKNETLAEYSRAYGFEDRLEIIQKDRMLQDAPVAGNKAINKVLADVFEAYVAAVILSDMGNGFSVAEKWLTTLWAPKLLGHAPPQQAGNFVTREGADALSTYNPAAKAELQKRVLSGAAVKLDYERWKPSVELKGAQLGQNEHYIAVYLTGYGHHKKLLGKGEGRNKVEAGNWAAQRAMHGEHKELIDACEKEMLEARARRLREKEERDAAAAAATSEGLEQQGMA